MTERPDELLVRLAQNDYMIDGRYLPDGLALLAAAEQLRAEPSDAVAKIRAAQECLHRVCREQSWKLRTHLPAKPDDDDFVISGGLAAAEARIAELEAAAKPPQPPVDDYRSLDHAMEILRTCAHPYTGEQAQKVAKALGALRAEVESRRQDCECYANHLAKNRDTITALRARIAELTAAMSVCSGPCHRWLAEHGKEAGDG